MNYEAQQREIDRLKAESAAEAKAIQRSYLDPAQARVAAREDLIHELHIGLGGKGPRPVDLPTNSPPPSSDALDAWRKGWKTQD